MLFLICFVFVYLSLRRHVAWHSQVKVEGKLVSLLGAVMEPSSKGKIRRGQRP